MNIVLLTSESDRLGGLFIDAYRKHNGPDFAGIVTIKHAGPADPFKLRLALAAKVLGLNGICRLTAAKFGYKKQTEPFIGLENEWPIDMPCSSGRVFHNRDSSDSQLVDDLASLEPDILVSVGVPVILGKKYLRLPRLGAINLHNGLLPNYRGHFGTFWEVHHQEKFGYVCIHDMKLKVDSGQILAWDRVNIPGTSSFFELLAAKKRMGGKLLADTLKSAVSNGRLSPLMPIPSPPRKEDNYFAFPSTNEIWKLHGAFGRDRENRRSA